MRPDITEHIKATYWTEDNFICETCSTDRGLNRFAQLLPPVPWDAIHQAYEALRDYLFATRANPRSGFWTAHKSAVRSMWAFGTGVILVEESTRGATSPLSYRYIPLSENHLGCDYEGNVDTNFRLFRRSALQCVQKWGTAMSSKVQTMAADPKQKDKPILILHAVYPRDERGSSYGSNRDAPYASCYVEVDEKKLIGESGFWEFPYRVDHWQRNNPGPYAEGPMAMALAEVKSLNMLAKHELQAVQQWVKPPYATASGTERLNLNSGAPNPGFLNERGELLAKPIVMQGRPDFATTILEARRASIRTALYIDLWQSIINSTREQTAYEVMIKNQEKGDLLGPLGSSLQTGLSFQVDREIGILGRREAFVPGSPLEAPRSVQGKGIGVRFTSPLDKMRRLPQVQGIGQLVGLAANVAQFKPDVIDKFDFDEMLDIAQDILGAPRKVMASDKVLAERRQARQMQERTAQGIAAAQGGGDAATAAAEGVQAIADNPAASEIMKRLAGMMGSGAGAPV